VRLTKATVEKLKAPDRSGKERLHWDDELKGFGVRCSGVSTTKTFVVQRRVRGRLRRVALTTFAELQAEGRSVDDVRAEAAELLVKMRRGEDPRAARRGEKTLREWRDEYLAARPRLSPRTRRTYEDALRGFSKWFDRPLSELSPEDVERGYRAVKEATARKVAKRKKPRSDLFVSEPGAAAANTALRVLRSIWRFAEGRDPGRVPPWPAERMRGAWYEVGSRERHVRADDLPVFYAAVNAREGKGEYVLGRLMRDFVLLLLFTGMRRDEAASLRWSDLDFRAGMIRVSAFRTKAKRRFDLPMSDLVRELLEARRALGVESEYVFPSSGKVGHLRDPRKALEAVSKAVGFQVNAHALRHTYETVAASVPMPGPALPALIHHALPKGVTAGYLHLTAEDLREPARDVGERLRVLCKAPRRRRRRGK
jgi:integrase